MDGCFYGVLFILRFRGYIVVLFLGGHFANLFLIWNFHTPDWVGEVSEISPLVLRHA